MKLQFFLRTVQMMKNEQKIQEVSSDVNSFKTIPQTPTYSEKNVPVILDDLATKKELLELENKYLKSRLVDQKWMITTIIAILGLIIALVKLLF